MDILIVLACIALALVVIGVAVWLPFRKIDREFENSQAENDRARLALLNSNWNC